MILGITGGIGSGKSMAADILKEEAGFAVFRTDDIARRLMEEDGELKEKLRREFGSRIFDADGRLNRKEYAAVIYSDPEKRRVSDSIVHPAVWAKTEELTGEQRKLYGDSVKAVVETALPGIEFRKISDTVWAVDADEDVRLKRLQETRGYTREYAETVIRQQPGREIYLRFADRIIRNNGTLPELKEMILGAL